MKTKFLFFAACLCLLFFRSNAQLIFPKEKIVQQNTEAAKQYLIEKNRELQAENITLDLFYYKKSFASHHYTFSVLYKNIPLLNAFIKINTDFAGNILSVKKENIETENLQYLIIEDEIARLNMLDFSQIIKNAYPIKNQYYKIDTRNDLPAMICEINCWDKTYDKTYILNSMGKIFEERNNSRYFKIDTLIHANVFKPDPLTALSQVYGGTYIDDADNNLPWFAPAYVQQDIQASFQTANNTFYLENDWVVLDDFDGPNILPVTSPTPDFYYNRSQSGFEDVNVLYHITNFHDYVSSLGYDTLMDDIITVDAHGMMGGDNSVFNRNGGNPTLDFGTGGVDDAEDADVVVHEYSHALSWSANANDNFSNARSGLDEGLADYFATSYSRGINPFNWEKVFSWDGNDQYWAGRTAATPVNYPNGANIYAAGEIWNAAMSAIWTDLGQIITDKLMLEAMHFFTNSTTLPEAAVYVLQSDTILFNGVHTNTICMHFTNKNIFDANCKPTGTVDVVKNNNPIHVKNTFGFSFQNENIEIEFDENATGSYAVIDLVGNKIFEEKFSNKKSVFVSPDNLSKGIYILNIQTEKNKLSVKISR